MELTEMIMWIQAFVYVLLFGIIALILILGLLLLVDLLFGTQLIRKVGDLFFYYEEE